MINVRTMEVYEPMTIALDTCFTILLHHKGDIKPIFWWKGFPSCVICQEEGKAIVYCKFFVFKSSEEEVTFEVQLNYTDTKGWIPSSVKAEIPNLYPKKGMYQEWSFTEKGELDLNNNPGWIPYFSAKITA